MVSLFAVEIVEDVGYSFLLGQVSKPVRLPCANDHRITKYRISFLIPDTTPSCPAPLKRV